MQTWHVGSSSGTCARASSFSIPRTCALQKFQYIGRPLRINRKAAAYRALAWASAHAVLIPKWGLLPKKKLHFWNSCEVCGNGDGVLVCKICQGQGIVATKPGGAGVPFYVGNAQCSSCKGHGFEPCPVCVGYEAGLPPPEPCNGPRCHENTALMTTRAWLRSFPDSRSKGAKRLSRKVRKESIRASAHSRPGPDAVESQADSLKWQELAKQFYIMHGSKRSR